MKRSSIFIALLLTLLLSSCANISGNNHTQTDEETLREFLISNSLKLTLLLDIMAESDEYIRVFTMANEILDFARDIGDAEYSAPGEAVILSMPNNELLTLIDEHTDIDMQDELLERLLKRFFTSVPASIINGLHGSTVLAASSILTVGESFIRPEGFSDNTCVILNYPDVATFTMFTITGDDIISASTTVVLLTEEMKEAISDRDIENFLFDEFGIRGISFVYVSRDEISDYS